MFWLTTLTKLLFMELSVRKNHTQIVHNDAIKDKISQKFYWLFKFQWNLNINVSDQCAQIANKIQLLSKNNCNCKKKKKWLNFLLSLSTKILFMPSIMYILDGWMIMIVQLFLLFISYKLSKIMDVNFHCCRTPEITYANAFCGDSYQCKFDYAVSLDRDLAFYTLKYQDAYTTISTTNKQRGLCKL